MTARDKNGFTLIEVLMAIVLLGIVGITAGMLLFQGTRSFESMDTRDTLTNEGTLAVERISRELRSVRCTTVGNRCEPGAADITMMTATELRFVRQDYVGRGFRFDAATVKLRQGSGTADPEDVLAGNVSSLQFEYLKQNGLPAATVAEVWVINTTLVLAKGPETLVFKSSVHPRGFR